MAIKSRQDSSAELMAQVIDVGSFRRFENQGFLRGALDRRLSEGKRSGRYIAPIVKLVFPVRIRRHARFAQSDPMLGLVPIAQVGYEAHRDVAAYVDCGAEAAHAVLWKRWNSEL